MAKQKAKQDVLWYGVLALALSGLVFSAATLITPTFFPPEHAMQDAPASHFGAQMTSFDADLAVQFMDKDGDGKCDFCGMPVEMCISSGQLQCSMDSSSTIGVLGSAHTHADFKVYVDGHPLDFSSPEHNVRSTFAHVEGGNGDVIHFHATGIPLWLFFQSIGAQLPESISVLVNGNAVAEKLDYVPKDKDRILITTSTGATIAQELASITAWSDRAT